MQHGTEVQRYNKISALGNPTQLSQTRSKNIKGSPQVSPVQSSWLPQKPPQVPSNLNPSVGMNHQVLLEKPYLIPSHSSQSYFERSQDPDGTKSGFFSLRQYQWKCEDGNTLTNTEKCHPSLFIIQTDPDLCGSTDFRKESVIRRGES